MEGQDQPKDGRARNIPNGGNGRPKGTPNKATSRTREAIAMVAEAMAPEFMGWLQRTADGDPAAGIKPDPKGAADIYLKAIEYHIPKLSRVEGHVTPGQTMTHEEWLASLE